MASIIIIDDDPIITRLIDNKLGKEGHVCYSAHTLSQGLEMARQSLPEMIFLDLSMPDGNGMDWLDLFLELSSTPEVIVITATGDESSVEKAIYKGAWDYIQKPLSAGFVTHLARQALRYHKDKEEKKQYVALKRPGIIGESSALQRCLQQVAQGAFSDAPCLIYGETGVGKELIARTIHANSNRHAGPFVVVDCAALSEDLAESTLFGHLKGAFTGAHADKKGLIESADQGVLFLDEIGELPVEVQKNLLRVLQEQSFRAVGAVKEKKSNFRLISATNRELTAMVNERVFREDLLYRIMGWKVFVPPLRKRLEDLNQLTVYFLQSICERDGLKTKGLSPDFLLALRSYDWPGNIRELYNCLENAVISAGTEPILYPQHLPSYIRVSIRSDQLEDQQTGAPAPGPAQVGGEIKTLKEAREKAVQAAEKTYLEQLLAYRGQSVRNLCRKAGVSRPHFYALLRKYNLPSPKIKSSKKPAQ
ncbi:MAG: sigma-54 dependent transcriptional regulator [Desulfobacteraceae bacterium]|nr:sigma-54 dependent transcriptional regulator [Desulfobacteraceae bacterium]